MALAFHNATFTAGAVSSNSRVVLHTATAGSVLLVFISNTEGVGMSAVAAAGVPMTRLGSLQRGGGSLKAFDIYGLTAPGEGILTISAVHVGNNPSIWALGAVTYTGQKTDGSPFGGVASATATGVTSLVISVSATAGNLLVVGFTNGSNNDLALGDGITNRIQAVGSSVLTMVIGDIAATGATHSLTASSTASLEWGALGIHLIASAGGAPATINGSATFTDVADSLSAPSYVVVQGTFAATDTTDTFAAPGKIIVRGTLTATDTPDTFAGTAGVRVSGTFAATDAADTFAAAGTARITGPLSATDAQDSFAASGQIIVTGLLSATDTPDTFVGLGDEALAVRSATFAATDTPDAFSAAAQTIVVGTVTVDDTADTFAATGTSDAATGSGAPAVVVTVDPGAGGGHARKSKKPPYIQARSDFWEARERYLESLQPEIVSEPEPVPVTLKEPENTVSAPVTSQLQAFRTERQQIIDALPLATSMRQLRAAGERLVKVNAQIAEQKRLQLAADLQATAIRKAERIARRKAALRPLKRKAVVLAAAQTALALSHLLRNP